VELGPPVVLHTVSMCAAEQALLSKNKTDFLKKSYFDSCASISIFPHDTPLMERKRCRTVVVLASGERIFYEWKGLHVLWGWGLVGKAGANIISQDSIRERYEVSYNDVFDYYMLKERVGDLCFYANKVQGVFEINLEQQQVETIIPNTNHFVSFAHRAGRVIDASASARAWLLHESYLHLHPTRMKIMLEEGRFKAWRLKASDIDEAGIDGCHACHESHDSIIHHIQHSLFPAAEIGTHFHADVAYVGKYRYLLMVEALCRYAMAFKLKSRSSESLSEAMIKGRNHFVHCGWTKPCTVWWDGEKGAITSLIAQELVQGMRLEHDGADQKEKLAEAVTKVLHNAMRAVYLGHPYTIASSIVHLLFENTVRVYNHLPNSSTKNPSTRWELVHRAMSVSHSSTNITPGFGVIIYVKELQQKKSLLSQRNVIAMVVGHEDNTRQLMVIPLDDDKLIAIKREDYCLANVTQELILICNKWAWAEPIVRYQELVRVERDAMPMSSSLGQPSQEDGDEEEFLLGEEFQESQSSDSGEESVEETIAMRVKTRSRKFVAAAVAVTDQSPSSLHDPMDEGFFGEVEWEPTFMSEKEFKTSSYEQVFFVAEKVVRADCIPLCTLWLDQAVHSMLGR
jgi:hypothetical protein